MIGLPDLTWVGPYVPALQQACRDAAAYDETMLAVFGLGFTEAEAGEAVRLAHAEDISRMRDPEIAERPQIHGRTLSKWRSVLSPAQVAAFEHRYGALLTALGYERSV